MASQLPQRGGSNTPPPRLCRYHLQTEEKLETTLWVAKHFWFVK